MSSGPHPSGDSTDDHLQVQNHHGWVARDVLVFGSGGSVHKTPSKWVNLLSQPFSNRFHKNLAYLSLQDWHLESGMKIMEDSHRKW